MANFFKEYQKEVKERKEAERITGLEKRSGERWEYTYNGFSRMRSLLHKYNNYNNVHLDICRDILIELQECILTISSAILHDDEMYDSWVEEIDEDIESLDDEDAEDDAEETVNCRLDEFYEFCDDLRIWLPF